MHREADLQSGFMVLANMLAPMMQQQQQQASRSPVKLELLKNLGAGQAALNPLSPPQLSLPSTQQLALPAADPSSSQLSVPATEQLAPAAAALPSKASLPAAQAPALTGLAGQASALQLPVQAGLPGQAKASEEAGSNGSAGEKRKSLEEFEQEAFNKLENQADKKRARKTKEKGGVLKRPCAGPGQLSKKNASAGTSSKPFLVCLHNNNLSFLFDSVAK